MNDCDEKNISVRRGLAIYKRNENQNGDEILEDVQLEYSNFRNQHELLNPEDEKLKLHGYLGFITN